MHALKAPYEQLASPVSHTPSQALPLTSSPTTPPPAPQPTPATPQKRKASTSVVDEATLHPQVRAKLNLLRRTRQEDAQRAAQLKLIMEEGQRKGEKTRLDRATANAEMTAKVAKAEMARVPVHIKIEHCAFQLNADNTPGLGKVKRSVDREGSIFTLHAPLLGYQCTTLQELRARIREAYLAEFGAIHRQHNCPSKKDGDIMYEICLDDMMVSEDHWHEVLAYLMGGQMPCSRMGKVFRKVHGGTFVASFTCPVSR